MQFLVISYDGTDAEAPARRQAARPAHLEASRRLKEEGTLIEGGAILDDQVRMIGSMALVDFPDREALDAWLARDPYVVGGVWQRIEVQPFRSAFTAPRS